MIKRMLIMLVLAGLLFGGIFYYKRFVGMAVAKAMSAMKPPPATVTSAKAELSTWQPRVEAVGSLVAEKGVDVSPEVAGIVSSVSFTSGDHVKAGQVLVRLDTSTDVEHLHVLQAAADLAKTVFTRDKAQLAARAVSQATLDADSADLKSKNAQVDEQKSMIAKKVIRAPFAGRLGVSPIAVGDYLHPGDTIVTLQSLDPIHVDFHVPQQDLARLEVGQTVDLTTDVLPNRTFKGKITAINAKIDVDTRNVLIEATLSNPKEKLLPGMYATVSVEAGAPAQYVTLPKTVVTYNPYGDTVYILETNEGQAGVFTAKQVFVKVGPTRGDQVAILHGVKAGDQVVTAGQLKLHNGSRVSVNNEVKPSNNPSPKPKDE